MGNNNLKSYIDSKAAILLSEVFILQCISLSLLSSRVLFFTPWVKLSILHYFLMFFSWVVLIERKVRLFSTSFSSLLTFLSFKSSHIESNEGEISLVWMGELICFGCPILELKYDYLRLTRRHSEAWLIFPELTCSY